MPNNSPVTVVAGVPRVDLMPRSETLRRGRASLVRMWAFLALGAAALGILIIGAALVFLLTANGALAAEEDRSARIAAERASLAPVDQAVTTRAAIEALRARVAANDVEWRSLLTGIGSRMPPEVTLVEFTLQPVDPLAAADPETDVGVAGTLTFIGPDPQSQTATIDALRTVPGHLTSDAGAYRTPAPGVVEFDVEVSFDKTALAVATGTPGAG